MFDRAKNKSASEPQSTDTSKNASTSASSAMSSTTHANSASSARNTAMIGPSINIKGEVTGEEDLVIQGRVEGTVSLKGNELSVGQSGTVFADVEARVIRIEGEVTGDITGNEKVVISQSGNVKGNIVAPRVTLEDGAIFKGSIDMDPGGAASEKLPPSTQQQANSPANSDLERKRG